MEWVHRRWSEWSFWLMVGGYLLFIPAIYWHPAWVAATTSLLLGLACMPVGLCVDLAYYRKLRREQER